MNIYSLVKAVLSTISLILLSDGHIASVSIFPYLILLTLYLLYVDTNTNLKILIIVSLILATATCLWIYYFTNLFDTITILLIGSGIYFLYMALLAKLISFISNDKPNCEER